MVRAVKLFLLDLDGFFPFFIANVIRSLNCMYAPPMNAGLLPVYPNPLLGTFFAQVSTGTDQSWWSTGSDGTVLAVAAATMVPGRRYTFTCKDASGPGAAQVSVDVRRQPTGGQVSIASEGRPDTFRVAASDFVGSVPGGALHYEFRYMLDASRVELPLRERGASPAAVVTFPAGRITAVVYIQDADTKPSGPADSPAGVRRELAPVTSALPAAQSDSGAGGRRLLQTDDSAAAAVYKSEVFDRKVQEVDVYGAASAAQAFGELFGDAPGSDTCADARSAMTPLKQVREWPRILDGLVPLFLRLFIAGSENADHEHLHSRMLFCASEQSILDTTTLPYPSATYLDRRC